LGRATCLACRDLEFDPQHKRKGGREGEREKSQYLTGSHKTLINGKTANSYNCGEVPIITARSILSVIT
jgi:hypothetical protein